MTERLMTRDSDAILDDYWEMVTQLDILGGGR